MTIYLFTFLFIISCGQVTGQSITERDSLKVLAEVENVRKQRAYLALLEDIRDSSSIIRIDSAKGKYSVKLKNKIEVYGFYNSATKLPIEVDNLIYLNTIIYNSLYINSNTGDIKDLNGWDTSSIIGQAQNAGCLIALTFAIADSNNVHAFLYSQNAQAFFIKNAKYLMKLRNASMINISFGNLRYEDNNRFISFINDLNRKLKEEDTGFKLLVTVPGIVAGNVYALPELAGITDRIIIDFSHNYSFTPSPLAALPALQQVISFFINATVLPESIVVCLPYHGVKWTNPAFYPNKSIEYINYTTLRKNYMFPGYINYLDETYVTSIKDSIGLKKDTLRRIYYDDELTLGFKYDFILQSGLKGVAVNALGEDYGYQGLWDEMSYAFAMPDTIHINSPKQIKTEIGPSFVRKFSILLISALAILLLLIFYILRRRKNYR